MVVGTVVNAARRLFDALPGGGVRVAAVGVGVVRFGLVLRAWRRCCRLTTGDE
jgi:hypothetical protein